MRDIILSITSNSDKFIIAAICLVVIVALVLQAIVNIVRGHDTVYDVSDAVTVNHYGKDGELIAESEMDSIFSALSFALTIRNHAVKNNRSYEMHEDDDGNLVLTVTIAAGNPASKTVFSREDGSLADLEQLFKNFRE